MNERKLLDISWESILKVLIAIIFLYFLYLAKNVFVWFIFAVIISVLFEPLINFLQRKRIPRIASAIIVYLIIFTLIGLSFYLTIPILTSEVRELVKILPQYFEKIAPPLRALGFRAFENIEEFTELLSKNLENVASTIFNAIAAIFGGLLATLSIFSIALFLSLEEKPIEKTLKILFPKRYEDSLLDLWKRCRFQISGWFLSRILGCIFVGMLTYISLLVFNTKYPFSLGFLAGMLNFLPIIGPILTGLVIFIVTFLQDFWRSVFVLLVFVLIQQLENNIVLPALTKKFVGLPPVLILLALTVGGTLWGIWGALLAIPFFGILFEFLREFLQRRKEGTVTI